MTAEIVVDALIVIFALAGILIGLKTGFIRLLFKRFKRLMAIVFALLLAKPTGRLLTDRFLGAKITAWIMSATGLTDTATASSPQELLESVPTVVRYVAQALHYDLDAVAQSAYESGEGMYHTIISELSYPLASAIAVVLCWIALYFIIRILLKILFKIADNVFELPVLKQINAVCGAALGLLINAAIVWVLCRVLVWAVGLPAVASLSFMQDFSIENTYIAKYVYHFNPIAFILSVNPK